MKIRALLPILIVLALWPLLKATSERRVEHQDSDNEEESEENVGARDAFRLVQLSDENGQIPPDAWAKALKKKQEMPVLQDAWREFWTDMPGPGPLPWVSIGPGNVGGRVRSIVVHPNNSGIIWAGAVTGGIWKSFNGGASWETNTDLMGNINVSCIVMDPHDPNVLYSGTGGETLTGNGIFKTTDGGKKWVPLSFTQHNPNFYGVNRLAVAPDSGAILAGTYTGMFRSTDGGLTWVQTTGTAGDMFDVHFHPTNSQKAIASGRWGNIYHSGTGGRTWTRSDFPVRPPGNGTIKVAYARSNPLIVYANTLTEDSHGQLYRSQDGGRSFLPMGGCCNSTLWWANCLWVDPTNADTVVFGGGWLYRSFNGGATRDYAYSHHQDHQIIVEDPRYDAVTNKTVYCGSDGGINKTDDILRNPSPPPPFGQSFVKWQNLNNGLAVTQFLGAAGNASSGTIIGGTQDNGALTYTGNTNWQELTYNGFNLGDAGYCASDQTDPSYFYTARPWLSLYRSSDGGKSLRYVSQNLPHECNGVACANFTAPFILDPNNEKWLLGGGVVLWKSSNVKEPKPSRITWETIKPPTPTSSFISAIAVAQGNSNLIWVGHLDGSVYYTTNGTAAAPTWTEVQGLPNRYCSSIAISENGNQVFVTFGGFTQGNVWRCLFGNWTDVSYGLPDIPVYSVVVSPTHPDILYLGTELGVFASGNRGATWSPGNRGPADVAVFTLFWMGSYLDASTFGRGLFTVGPATH